MKLYIYEHCPFCVRTRMIFGKRMVPVELEYLANDDDKTPIGLIGQKMVPILVKDDGTAMGESLDIVRYINQLSGAKPLNERIRLEIEGWLRIVNTYQNFLIMPRCIKLNLPEFATETAINYFVKKKTTIYGDFEQNLANTKTYIERFNSDLIALSPLISSYHGLNGEFSMEDILVFPILRNLTMVKDVQWTAPVLDYLNGMSRITGIPLFDQPV